MVRIRFLCRGFTQKKILYIKTDTEKIKENKIGYRAIVELENDKSVGIIIGKSEKTKEWEICPKNMKIQMKSAPPPKHDRALKKNSRKVFLRYI